MNYNGFYSISFGTSIGSGMGVLAFQDGKVVGADAAGVTYDGTYETNGTGSVNASILLNIPAGVLSNTINMITLDVFRGLKGEYRSPSETGRMARRAVEIAKRPSGLAFSLTPARLRKSVSVARPHSRVRISPRRSLQPDPPTAASRLRHRPLSSNSWTPVRRGAIGLLSSGASRRP